MPEISIIVPLYKGNKYTQKILENAADCLNICRVEAEIIFVNDYPDETIYEHQSAACRTVYISNSNNEGIHKSRVNGLMAASGKYIVFLDQDDILYPDYLRSQMEHIGNADAVVCRLINGEREHYTDSFRIEDVVCKEFMMNKWCSIVSPGQVLIRRESIPDIWINNIVKTNGADDYFLWLAMFASGCKIVTNDEMLFQHTVTGINTSCDTFNMMQSESEIINILNTSDLLGESEKQSLINLKDSLSKIHLKVLDDTYVAFQLMRFMEQVDLDYLYIKLGSRIGIYGAADIGTVLCNALQKHPGFDIAYIDRNAKYITKSVPVYLPTDIPDSIDTIIIALRDKNVVSDVKAFLSGMKCKVMSLDDFINC